MLARLALLASLLVLGLFCLGRFSGRSTGEGVAAPRPLVSDTVEDEQVSLTAPSEPGRTEREPRVVVEAGQAADVGVIWTATADAAAMWTRTFEHPTAVLRGRVSILGDRGQLEPLEEGRLSLRTCRSSPDRTTRWGGEEKTVKVRAGAWHLELDPSHEADALEVVALMAGDARLSIVTPPDLVDLDVDRELEIIALRPRPVILRVVDALTGADLDQVTVRRPSMSSWLYYEHPGVPPKGSVAFQGVRSPIALSDTLCSTFNGGRTTLVVGARGYAWTRIELDFGAGGDRLVALQPGGDLSLQVRGLDPRSPTHLRLRYETGPEAEAHADFLLRKDGIVLLGGLPAGKVVARAELGWSHQAVVLGEVAATLVPGIQTDAVLQLGPAPRTKSSSASGRVLVPCEWNLESAQVGLHLLDPQVLRVETSKSVSVARRDTPLAGMDVFDWSFHDVQPGRHELKVWTPPCSVIIEVPEGKSDGHLLQVASPVELSVRVTDSASGVDLRAAEVRWRPEVPQGIHLAWLHEALLDETLGEYSLRLPAGGFMLDVSNEGYRPYRADLDTRRDPRRLEIVLERACGVVMLLFDAQVKVPFPPGWEAQLVRGDGAATERDQWTQGGYEHSVTLKAPGTYTMQPPKIPGYKQPPLQRIEVRPGEFTQHVVQLEREHP